MAKRRKAPRVSIQLAREWLRRSEAGESPPDIAKKDGFDPRTVRSQIALIKKQIEESESRKGVMRSALSRHFMDLCSFAKKLNREIISKNEPSSISNDFISHPLWRSLFEHIPRSNLWKNINALTDIESSFEQSAHALRDRIEKQTLERARLPYTVSLKEQGVYDGWYDGLLFHAKSVARGGWGLETIEYRLSGSDYGTVLERGAYKLAMVSEEKVEALKQLFNKQMNDILDWKEFVALKDSTDEFNNAVAFIKEELNKIILRRIVPGRCRYCPF